MDPLGNAKSVQKRRQKPVLSTPDFRSKVFVKLVKQKNISPRFTCRKTNMTAENHLGDTFSNGCSSIVMLVFVGV